MKVARLEEVFGKYRTIYLDPPWPYDRRPLGRRELAEIYTGGVMALNDICSLPIPQLGHPDGYVVFLWCTWPKIRDGYHLKVLDAWGLDWRSELVWDKVTMGTGRWLRKQTEILLIATPRGYRNLLPQRLDQRDIVSVKRGTRHSEKPAEFRRLIEKLTTGPRMELFARTHAKGWDVWGAEAPGGFGVRELSATTEP